MTLRKLQNLKMMFENECRNLLINWLIKIKVTSAYIRTKVDFNPSILQNFLAGRKIVSPDKCSRKKLQKPTVV